MVLILAKVSRNMIGLDFLDPLEALEKLDDSASKKKNKSYI